MAASAPGPQMLALPRLSANVVMGNAANPNGAGSAVEYACGTAGSGPSPTSSRLVKSDSGAMLHYLLGLMWSSRSPYVENGYPHCRYFGHVQLSEPPWRLQPTPDARPSRHATCYGP